MGDAPSTSLITGGSQDPRHFVPGAELRLRGHDIRREPMGRSAWFEQDLEDPHWSFALCRSRVDLNLVAQGAHGFSKIYCNPVDSAAPNDAGWLCAA